MDRRIAVVCNPKAQLGAAQRLLPQVRQGLENAGVPHDVFLTTHADEAPDLARKAVAEGFTTVLAMGGDGTFHQVLNGLHEGGGQFSKVDFGVLPCGSGNDFPRSMRIPREVMGALEVALRGATTLLDVGSMTFTTATGREERCFLSVAGSGLPAKANELGNLYFKAFGSLCYILGAAVTIISNPITNMTLIADGVTIKEPVSILAVANTRFFGNGMEIVRTADPTDGKLDLLVGKATGRAMLIWNFPKIFSGAHMTHPSFRLMKVDSVELRDPVGAALYCDGEIYRGTPATFRVYPRAIRLLT